jgi:hypothetical protein
MAAPVGESVVPSSPDSMRAAAAENLAAWHELSAAALGLRTRRDAAGWAALDPIPVIFFDWVGLRGGTTPSDCERDAERLLSTFGTDRRLTISDPWNALPLARHGFRAGARQPWMVRGAAPVPAALTPADLDIERVADPDALATFEATSLAGFEATPVRPFTYHGPAILRDDRAHFWTGRVDGRAVVTAMAFVEAGVVGVYGVATVPDARHRGYATALTAIALTASPGCPAVLQPSAAAEPLYVRLGFRRFAEFGTWLRRFEA